MCNENGRVSQSIVWSLLIIAVGLIFLLDSLGYVSAGYIFRYFWPAVFILFGLEGLCLRAGPGRFWGLFLVVAGILFLMDRLHYLHVSFAVLWPLALVFWGVWLMVYGRQHGVAIGVIGRSPRAERVVAALRESDKVEGRQVLRWDKGISMKFESTESRLEYAAVFSYFERRITSQNFTGGKLDCVFGGFKIDLTEAQIAGDQATLEVNAVFGGGEIRVPDTWLISTPQSAAVFGAFTSEVREPVPSATPPKRLQIKGAAVFGGVVIKN
jgi:predicted membrane protein